MPPADIIQGTPEWYAARLGKVTASCICDVIAKTKSGWGASRANYMAQLVAERLTGEVADSYVSGEMQRGKDIEAEARTAYEFRSDVEVSEVGFVPHPRIEMAGASPDGLVGDNGLVEIKVPNTATHIATLLGKTLPDKYVVQMLWQMACTGRQWCDFVSYDPRMPPQMRLFVRRLDRDDTRICELEKLVTEFLSELDRKVMELRFRYEHPGQGSARTALEDSLAAMDGADRAAAQSVVWAG